MEAAQIIGTVVFAVSGVLAVAGRPLDWFGAIVVGVVTAIGGGTIRGLILGLIPVFWISDDVYLFAAIAGAVVAIPLAHALARRPGSRVEDGVQVADAVGLSLFVVVGADIALEAGFSASVAVIAGLVSGVGGGVIRDLLAGRTPLIMRGEIYATAAVAGAVLFVALEELTAMPEPVAGTIGGLVVVGLRLLGLRRNWELPTLSGA
jgi:uncharacterized membrane protein YeiH